MAQRFAAAAIVLAIVAARMISGGGPTAPMPHANRVALATAVSPARVPARSLRADREAGEPAHHAVAGALLAPTVAAVLPVPPPPNAAPPFIDPSPPRPRLAAAAARARAPPQA